MHASFRLHVANNSFTAQDILTCNAAAYDPYTCEVLVLCKNWLEGMEHYELKTSGSTGVPKTIQIQRAQIEASAQLSLHFFNLKAGDKVCCPLSVHVIGGQMMLYRSLIGGLELYILPPSKNLEGLNTALSYSFMPIAAMQLFTVLTEGNKEKIHNLNQLQHLLIGGSSISTALYDRIKEVLHCSVWHSYGMTETVSHIAMKNISPAKEEAYTLLDGIEMRTDERSCLKIKGAVTQDAWIQTNDCVILLDNTHFNFIGRADFTVNSGGVKIQVEPIEKTIDALFNALGIDAPFFVGAINDATLGEKLTLFIQAKDFISENSASILNQLVAILPKYHVPKSILPIEFEYTASGKIDRKKTIEKIKAIEN